MRSKDTRVRELLEKKWTLEARVRLCTSERVRAKWKENIRELEKMIRLNKLINDNA